MDVGLLDHGGQRLLGHTARLQEAREVAALAKLRDAQLNRARARLPDAVAVAVALHEPVWRAFSESGAGEAGNLHLHQPFGGEADHLAQDVRVGRLLNKRAKGHHVVGHRWFPGCVGCRNPILPVSRR